METQTNKWDHFWADSIEKLRSNNIYLNSFT